MFDAMARLGRHTPGAAPKMRFNQIPNRRRLHNDKIAVAHQRARSSADQSVCLLSRGSGVRFPPGAPLNSSGLAYYRHSDWVGSSRLASTPSRTVYFDGAYAPFGEVYANIGTNDFSFTGMNQDTVPNLYDFPGREYGIQGRWPSWDPAGLSAVFTKDPQTLNRYAYVRNSPLHLIDPEEYCPAPAQQGQGQQEQQQQKQEKPPIGFCTKLEVVGTGAAIIGGGIALFGTALDATIFGAIIGVPAQGFGTVGAFVGGAVAGAGVIGKDLGLCN